MVGLVAASNTRADPSSLPVATRVPSWLNATTPGSIARLAVRFSLCADPRHPYMFHCHLLFHEGQRMMGQFVITGPG